jgi:glycosyltransferase involved in cell wall biosynthesis
MERPRISAIVPAYNCSEFLRGALDSVLEQTLVPDEILVVDDGSMEDLRSIVMNEYAPRVQYIHQQNLGVGLTRNTGVQNTTGDLIAILDCDDIWIKDKTELQVAYMQANPQAVMVSGQKLWWNMENDKKFLVTYPQYPMNKLRREIMVHNIVGSPSMIMFRRDALLQAGLFSALPWGQDWECWIKLSMLGEVGYVDQPVVVYRWHTSNVSHQNRLARVDCLEGISMSAIRTYQPILLRPFFWARAKSNFLGMKEDFSRREGIAPLRRRFYALAALLLWPGDNFRQKVITFFREFFGEKLYQQVKAKIIYPLPERGAD